MSTPWLPRETRWVAATGVVALILLVVCWYQAAGEGEPGEQMPWLDVGAAGVALYWVLAGRTVARARRRVAARRQVQLATLAQPRWTMPVDSEGASAEFVVAPGMARAHRPGCPLITGKPTSPAPADAPGCGICG
jgi:hypothetical protein